MYRNLAVVQQKIYSYLTHFKNVAYLEKIFYALRQSGPHHVVCLRAPIILNPPLVMIDGILSDVASPNCGVPQGSGLGPSKFCLYLLPIAAILRYHNIGYQVYTDDTQITTFLSKTKTHLVHWQG